MNIISLTIRGTHPLLQHNPAAMLRGDTPTVGAKTTPTAEEEVARALYVNDKGQFYHPAEAFRIALINAGVNRKIGKLAATTTTQRAVFQLNDEALLLNPDTKEPLTEEDMSVDERSVVVQGGRIMRARPKWNDWAVVVDFEFDPDFVSADVIVELMNIAGRIEGVGDYRPSAKAGPGRGGPFGRFRVESFDVEEDEAIESALSAEK